VVEGGCQIEEKKEARTKPHTYWSKSQPLGEDGVDAARGSGGVASIQ